MERTYITLLFLLVAISAKHDYNFGLLENEPLLRLLCKEDRHLHNQLMQLNATGPGNHELQRFLNISSQTGRQDDMTPEAFVKHPVNSYNLIKRATVYVPEALRLIRGSGDEELADKVQGLVEATKLYKDVTRKDMVGALHGLTMIIHAYKLKVELLSKGQLSSETSGDLFEAGSKLEVSDLVFLAQTAEDEGYLDTAADLLRGALLLAKDPQSQVEEGQMKLLKKKRKMIFATHNGVLKKRQSYLSDKDVVNSYMLNEKLERAEKQPKFVTKGESLLIDWERLHDYGGIFSEMERQLEGCRNFPKTNSRSVPLHRNTRVCRHLHHTDPFHRLAPFKLEVASEHPDPHIVVIHGMLEEEDIRHWVDWAEPRLSRTRGDSVKGAAPPKGSNGVRIVHKAVQAWKNTIVFEGEKDVDVGKGIGYPGLGEYTPDNFTILDPRAERLSRRLERALALNVTNQWSSHTYQVTNYGLAGTCEAHVDPHGYLEGKPVSGERSGLRMTGDYIGTTMGWLEDTPAGGGTTFFNLGMTTTVQPTRGSVAFWFSLLQDGTRDRQTTHGGCPVAFGSKWIFNKWIYSFNNWNRHPCGLRPSSGAMSVSDWAPHRITWPRKSYF